MKTKRTKILVTGGAGYIGSHTSVALLEAGFETVILDNFSNSTKETVSRIQAITNKKPQLEVVDLKNFSDCQRIFSKHSDAKTVIHFAAYKAVSESVKKPLDYYNNNIVSLINTLYCMSENGIPNFIFSSSATVYGKPDEVPINEQAKKKRPFSPYGNSKKIAEEILEDLTLSDDITSIISLRYFNPIGAHKSTLIGELPLGTPNNLMPFITQTAIGLREKLWVYGTDYPTRDGTPIRDYIHIMDLAEAHLKSVERLLKNENEQQMEVFNIGSGVGHTVLEIIEMFEKISHQKLNYEITNRRAGDVPELVASSELAERKLKWKVKRDLRQTVISAWEWEKKLNLNKG